MKAALSHLRVLDLTHYIAGPACTKLLADFGADVIKVERPGLGDGARRMGPFAGDAPDLESSGLFLYLNSNKRGVTLNLASERGQQILTDLARQVDIVVSNFSPRQMERLNISHERLKAVNRSIGFVTITNFGMNGPYRDYEADHLVLCALGGWANFLGPADRPPLQAGAQMAARVAGTQGAVAALAASQLSRATGGGHHIDVSIMETIVHLLPASTMQYAIAGAHHRRGTFPFPNQGILRCKDGYVGINALTEDQWEMLARWMGMQHWLDNPKLRSAAGRWEVSDQLRAEAEAWLSKANGEDLFHSGQAWRAAVGLVATTADLLGSKQLAYRDYFTDVTYPKAGKLRHPGPPVRLTKTPWQFRRQAPSLGEHNQEIYGGWLGMNPREIRHMAKGNII